MTENRLNWRTLGLPVYLALALLVVVAGALIVAIVSLRPMPKTIATEPVSSASYRARVDTLLGDAHPEDAEALVQQYGCTVCHREGAANGIAPSWVGIAGRAAMRRPPMPADAYLYESIINPSAYVVDGYADLMPQNFAERLSDQDLGDIIAYLLTPDAH